MTLTSLPTKSDASLGRVKTEVAAPPNLDNYLAVSELEAIKTFLVDVCGEVGIHVGTAGDLNTRVDALESAGPVVDGDFAGAYAGALVRTGAGTYAALKHNLAATAAPTVGDDSANDFAVGSLWVDVTNDRIYMATDVTVGAAVWREIEDTQAVLLDGTRSMTGDLDVGGNDLTNFGQAIGGAGSALSPTFAMTGAGIFQSSSNRLSIATNNGERFRVTGGALRAIATSSKSAPAFSYESDTDTGLFIPAVGEVGLAAGGEGVQLDATDFFPTVDATLSLGKVGNAWTGLHAALATIGTLLRIRAASVSTSDGTATALWTDTTQERKTVLALVSVRQTGVQRDEYGHWLLIGQWHIDDEAVEVVTSTQVAEGGTATVTGGTYEAQFVLNVSDQLELRVTGAAATTLDWDVALFDLDQE